MAYLRTIFKLDQNAFNRAIARRILTGRKLANEVVTQSAKLVLREIIPITPPASGGKRGTAAKKQGEGAIRRDLLKVFEPIDLKHVREEVHTDVPGIYSRLRKSRGDRFSVRRDRKAKYYVSRDKALKLFLKLSARVGIMLSGWYPAALKLGVSMPAWAKRHGRGRGSIDMRLSKTAKPTIKPLIIVTARTPNERMRAALQRRVDWAVRKVTASYDRQWKYFMKHGQRKLNRVA